MNTPKKIRLCNECLTRPRPTDSFVCGECAALLATREMRPRRSDPRNVCVTCGAHEGDPHDWSDHELADLRQQAEREREERIAEMVTAKLAAPVDATPQSPVSAKKAAAFLGIKVPTFRKRVQRGDYRGAIRYIGKRRYEVRLDRLVG